MSEVTTTQTAAYTQPLSANEIFRSLPPNYSISRPILDQYLSLLVDDPVRADLGSDSPPHIPTLTIGRSIAELTLDQCLGGW